MALSAFCVSLLAAMPAFAWRPGLPFPDHPTPPYWKGRIEFAGRTPDGFDYVFWREPVPGYGYVPFIRIAPLTINGVGGIRIFLDQNEMYQFRLQTQAGTKIETDCGSMIAPTPTTYLLQPADRKMLFNANAHFDLIFQSGVCGGRLNGDTIRPIPPRLLRK